MRDQKDIYPEAFEKLRPDTSSESRIAVTGSWDSRSHSWDIDWKPVFNKLIQLAGTFCSRYASDVLIDLDSLLQDISELIPDVPGVEGKVYSRLFGFRELGTDHTGFVHCRLSSRAYGPVERIYPGGIWQLDIRVKRQADSYILFCELFPMVYVPTGRRGTR